MIGCNFSSSKDNKENELLKKEIELLKKEKELSQHSNSDKKSDESSVYNKKEAPEIKQSVGDRIIEIKAFYSKIQSAPNKENNCISATETRNDELRGYPFKNTAKECQLADNYMYQQVKLKGWEWEGNDDLLLQRGSMFHLFI